ncbi:LCP family protein [Leucobacter sp. USHLN153]|uniref:LCP family protein n=1 Tax=Leucobacter sp. USHLN153 TaxID=3081268 RepID=UPI00301954A7
MAEKRSTFEALLEDADQAPAETTNARRARKKRHPLRNTLIVVGSLIALLAIAAGIAYAVVASSFNEVQRVSIEQDPSLERPEAVKPAAGKNAPINILLMGSDSRETVDPDENAAELNGFRSDAILVAQIAPDRKSMTIMSIMRDNWVEIQGQGEAKINAAVALGGVPLAVNTVENFIGSRIDHVALIDFESFKGLTDALGGVVVNNPLEFTAKHGGQTFQQGKIMLDGDRALSFVRERYAFSDGDYQRARNQQAYLGGVMDTLLRRETLTDVNKLANTFKALKPYLILDEGLDLTTAAKLGLDLRSIRRDDVRFFTSPTLGTGTSADGQSIVVPDTAELENVRAAFRDGTLNEYAETRGEGSELPQ